MCRSISGSSVHLDDMIANATSGWCIGPPMGPTRASFWGVAPTRKTASVTGTSIYRIKNQKIDGAVFGLDLLTLTGANRRRYGSQDASYSPLGCP